MQAHFSAEIASKVLPVMKAMMTEFFASDALFNTRDLVEMTDMATRNFRAKHPEVTDEILQDMDWLYSFSMR